MTFTKKIITLVALIAISYSAAISPCIGWFYISEYEQEVTIIKEYMVKSAGMNNDAGKLISWLEKRVAFTDITPECLKAIAQIASDQNISEHKKMKKLQSMMQHDKMTRFKDELKQLRQETIQARHELFMATMKPEPIEQTIEVENKRIEAENKRIQKEEDKRIEQEWNKRCIRQAKEVFVTMLGMTAALAIGMPAMVAGTKYAEELVKFYVAQWNK